METTLETDLLRHDWCHQYSDDFRVWLNGQNNESSLKARTEKSPFSWTEIRQAFMTREGSKIAEILAWARNNG